MCLLRRIIFQSARADLYISQGHTIKIVKIWTPKIIAVIVQKNGTVLGWSNRSKYAGERANSVGLDKTAPIGAV